MNIIFDLDDTLYQNKVLSNLLTNKTKNWIKRKLSIKDKKMDVFYKKLQRKYPNPYDGFESLGLSIQEYHNEVFHKINPMNYINTDRKLKKLLGDINKDLIVVSFAPISHCQDVLDALNIKSEFNKIHCVKNHKGNSKKFLYKKIGEKNSIVFGDNYKIDIKPAMELNYRAIHVSKDCNKVGHPCYKSIHLALEKVLNTFNNILFQWI